MSKNDWLVTLLLALQGTIPVLLLKTPVELGIPAQMLVWASVLVVPIGIVLNRLNTIGASVRPGPGQTTGLKSDPIPAPPMRETPDLGG